MASSFSIKAGGVTLPSPVEVSSSGELIWSAATGRTSSGKMVGNLIAEKQTFEVSWGVLTAAQVKSIEQAVTVQGGFFQLTITQGSDVTRIQCYRGPVAKKVLGYIGDGVFYYRSVTVTFIEQ
jgi:hypothetical protein